MTAQDISTPLVEGGKKVARKQGRSAACVSPAPTPGLDDQVAEWAAAMWEESCLDRLDYLRQQRGLSERVIIEAQVGFDGERYTIPVFDRDAHTIYVKRYLPDGNPKMLLPKGSKAALFGAETLRNLDDGCLVLVTEGELDALLCRTHGYHAVSGTTGAGTWLDEWSETLAAFEVVLAGDHDRAGREFNRKAAKSLAAAGGHAVTLEWPAGTPEKTDVTDFVVTQGHEPAELQALIDVALESDRLRSLDLGRCLTETIEPIPWIIPGWLAERDIVCLAGEPKLGKSLVALEAGLSLARPGRVLQHINVRNGPYRVLYVDEENNPRLIRYRVRKLARGLGLGADDLATLPLRYLSENTLNLDDDGRLQALFREARRFRPDLVILDSLVRFHRRDENSNAAMSELFTGAIKPLATQFDCAVLMLHHMAKPSKDRAGGSSHRVRGASDITAQVDQLWLLERAKSGDLRLKHSMSRWAETAPTLNVTIEDTEEGDGSADRRTGGECGCREHDPGVPRGARRRRSVATRNHHRTRQPRLQIGGEDGVERAVQAALRRHVEEEARRRSGAVLDRRIRPRGRGVASAIGNE